MSVRILIGDCREKLRELPDASVNCCVTSPPYFGLRDYGCEGQMGLEPTPDEFVAGMVEVFREVRRVLRDDGTLWLNIGDSYNNYASTSEIPRAEQGNGSGKFKCMDQKHHDARRMAANRPGVIEGVKRKDLIGIPWMLAFALRADGWYLRQDIIWSKPNPMPESIRDRCTKAHEYLFLMAKSERYYFDQEAIAQPVAASTIVRLGQPTLEQQEGSDRVPGKTNGNMKAKPPRFGGAKYGDIGDGGAEDETRTKSGNAYEETKDGKRNRRSVWEVPTQPFSEAHFATFPPALIEPCILAGCPEGGTVLDPFFGAGTTGLVADRMQRHCIGIELNAEYAELARKRLMDDAGVFADISVEHTGPATRAA